MAYSNDITQIKNGLINYIGSAAKASKYEGKTAKHCVNAMVMETLLELSKNEDNEINLFEVKPIIRSVIKIFENRIMVLSKGPKIKEINNQIESYKQMISFLKKFLDTITE